MYRLRNLCGEVPKENYFIMNEAAKTHCSLPFYLGVIMLYLIVKEKEIEKAAEKKTTEDKVAEEAKSGTETKEEELPEEEKSEPEEEIDIVFMLLIVLVIVFPLMNIISLSVSDTMAVRSGTVTIYPKGFSLKAYGEIIENKLFTRSVVFAAPMVCSVERMV